MLDFLEAIHGAKFSPSTRLIDPACGEGVFLRVAHERGGLPPTGLFGADIDEVLAPGWRKDPLLSGATLLLANGLLDAPQAGIVEGTFDLVVGNPPFSGTGLRDLLRLLEDSPEGASPQERDFFEPCYLKEGLAKPLKPLSLQERAELDRLLRAVSQYSCWRLDAEVAEEEAADSESAPRELFAAAELFDRRRPTASDYERTAHLIAHWPPDRPLDISRPELRDTVRRLAGTAIEVFFTERFLRLAKRGGLIAIIVPESIVASDRVGPLRLWLLRRMDLLSVVTLPQKVFTGAGANARTYMLFARRRAQDRPDGQYSLDPAEQSAEEQKLVWMVEPQDDAPNFKLEAFLAGLLPRVRQKRKQLWPYLL